MNIEVIEFAILCYLVHRLYLSLRAWYFPSDARLEELGFRVFCSTKDWTSGDEIFRIVQEKLEQQGLTAKIVLDCNILSEGQLFSRWGASSNRYGHYLWIPIQSFLLQGSSVIVHTMIEGILAHELAHLKFDGTSHLNWSMVHVVSCVMVTLWFKWNFLSTVLFLGIMQCLEVCDRIRREYRADFSSSFHSPADTAGLFVALLHDYNRRMEIFNDSLPWFLKPLVNLCDLDDEIRRWLDVHPWIFFVLHPGHPPEMLRLKNLWEKMHDIEVLSDSQWYSNYRRISSMVLLNTK